RYAEAAAKGRELIELRPDQAYLYFNAACCESLAGEKAEAIEHLRQAIDMWDGCREMAKRDSDFDPLRDEPAFTELIGRSSQAGSVTVWTSTLTLHGVSSSP